MHFQPDTHMKVLLPHWFDDAVTLGIGGLPTEGYEWPDPKYLRNSPEEKEVEDGKKGAARKGFVSNEKKKLLQAVGWKEVPASVDLNGVKRDVWSGRKILLSLSLELTGGRREAVETGIRRAGGVIVAYKKKDGDGDSDEEVRKVKGADILVTRYRHGDAYLKVRFKLFDYASLTESLYQALKMDKTIGTLTWLFHVESTGVLTPPTDQLLHYPIPKRSIAGFSPHVCVVSSLLHMRVWTVE